MDIETQELRYQLESQGMDTGMGIIINIRDLDRLTVVALFRHSFYRSTVYTHTMFRPYGDIPSACRLSTPFDLSSPIRGSV